MFQLPAKGSQNISMHAEVTDGNMLKTGWKLLTDKKDTHFTARFTGKIDTDNKMLSASEMVTSIDGTLDEIINAVKKAKR